MRLPVAVLAGGNGFLGKSIAEELSKRGFSVRILSRKPTDYSKSLYHWNPATGEIDTTVFKDCSVLINLAGENIGEKRWTEERKQQLLNSRVQSTSLLASTLAELNLYPHVVQGSAVGFYGHRTEKIDESSSAGTGFLASLTKEWESAASAFSKNGCTLAIIRTGVVLSSKGGAFAKMALPFNWKIGSALGSGKQFLPWISLTDITKLFCEAAENKWEGIYNGVSPNPVTNLEFSRELNKAMKNKFLLPAVPAFLLKLVLGEMQELVLEGAEIEPKKPLEKGMIFEFANLSQCLVNVLKSNE